MRPAEAREFSIPEAERSRYARVLVVKSNSTPTGVEFTVRADYNADFEAVSLACVDLRKAKPGPDEKALAVLTVLARMEGSAHNPIASKDWQTRAEAEGLGARATFFTRVKTLREANLVQRDEEERYSTIRLSMETAGAGL